LGCISRQTYGIVKRLTSLNTKPTWKPHSDWQVSYVPHGIDKTEYFPTEVPTEFRSEILGGKEYDFIKTIDTSNPVIYGLKHGKYPDEVLLDKPKEKLETFFDQQLTQQQISDVLHNVKHFRTLLS
jgi:hypothetical protein